MNNIKFNYDEIVEYAMYDIKSGKLIAGYNFEDAEKEDNMSEYKYKLEDFEEGNVYQDTQGFKFKLDKYGRLLILNSDGSCEEMTFYHKMLEEKYKLIKPKPTIPKETLHFLKKYVDEKIEWLARDKDGELWAYMNKPKRYTCSFGVKLHIKSVLNLSELSIKYGLDTSFIKWEDEPVNFRKYIEELESEER